MLRPVSEIWGAAELLDGEPRCPVQQRATYVPKGVGPVWGLFDEVGLPFPETVTHVAEVRLGAPFSLAKIAEQPLVPFCGTTSQDVNEPFIYVGCPNFHFGHFLVETLPRLWAVGRLRREDHRRKLLIQGDRDTGHFLDTPWIAALLGALHLSRDDFVWFDCPVRLRDVVTPAPALEAQVYAFTLLREFFREMGDAIAGDTPPPDPRPIYLTKTGMTGGVQRVVNEGDMLPLLEAKGVRIVAPETLGLAEQIRLFSSGRVIMGTASSAFHVCILSRGFARSVLLQPFGQLNSNHLLCFGLSGSRATFLTQDGSSADRNDPNFLTSFHLADPAAAAAGLLEAGGIA